MLKQWTKTVTICQTPKEHKEWRALKCKLVTFNSVSFALTALQSLPVEDNKEVFAF